MHIVWTVVIGFLVGMIARLIAPGKEFEGFFFTTVLGIVGAFIGSLLGQMLGFYQTGELAGFAMSVLGAWFILVLFKKCGCRKSIDQIK